MFAMQQPAMIHLCPSGTTIKDAMAASLGSSLFLFNGLHAISPYLLNQASASSPVETTTTPNNTAYSGQPSDDNMKSMRKLLSGHNPNRASKPPKATKAPRDSRRNPVLTRPRDWSFIILQCETCRARGVADCRMAADICGGGLFAYSEQGAFQVRERHREQTQSITMTAALLPPPPRVYSIEEARSMPPLYLYMDVCSMGRTTDHARHALKVAFGDPYMDRELGREVKRPDFDALRSTLMAQRFSHLLSREKIPLGPGRGLRQPVAGRAPGSGFGSGFGSSSRPSW
ncbi:hypothetical protein B0T19DRAFT_398469 [Cercophora scortea]|uniref:Uncharacterized protein n=1 Tax=Cercophora scortea TaxID=314031 RepID=A0AAE0IXG8_9PEZI|nr:hypothetical protein B0T19DRAFT_398469 [Cercophora scortea]